MTDFGSTPLSDTTIGANQIPMSAVYPPGNNGAPIAMQGGTASTDGNGFTSAPGVVELADSGGVNKAFISSGGALKVDGSATTQPVSGTVSISNLPGTQPVSAASLPLPTGAATVAKQPALGTAGAPASDVLSVQGIASMTAFKVDGSAVTQPVSGTVTANAGTNLNTSTLALEAGGNLASANTHLANIDADSASIATNTGTLAGAISGGKMQAAVASALPAGSNTIGNVEAIQSGTWTVQPGNTPNTSAWLVQDVAGATGGATTYHLVSASGTNATNVKSSAGLLYGFSVSNTNAAARYLHLYNVSGAPTVGTTVPTSTIQIPGNATVIRAYPVGATYGTGIAFGASTGAGDTDSGSIGAGDLVIDLEYK